MSTSSPSAGGALIAAGAILGAVTGVIAAQPTLGFLLGSGAGIIVATILWWRDR